MKVDFNLEKPKPLNNPQMIQGVFLSYVGPYSNHRIDFDHYSGKNVYFIPHGVTSIVPFKLFHQFEVCLTHMYGGLGSVELTAYEYNTGSVIGQVYDDIPQGPQYKIIEFSTKPDRIAYITIKGIETLIQWIDLKSAD